MWRLDKLFFERRELKALLNILSAAREKDRFEFTFNFYCNFFIVYGNYISHIYEYIAVAYIESGLRVMYCRNFTCVFVEAVSIAYRLKLRIYSVKIRNLSPLREREREKERVN